MCSCVCCGTAISLFMCVGVPQILLYWLFFAFALFPLYPLPPLHPSLLLFLVLRVFVLLHWLVYFPFGFDAPRAMWLWLWLWAAAFRQSVWLFTFSTCKTKGGTRKLSFAGGRKSNGTRATLAQPSAWKGVNKCAGEFVRQCFLFSFFFLYFFQLCFALMRRKETFQQVALTLTGFQNIYSLSPPLRAQYKVVSVVGEIKMKLLKICHNKLPQWRQIFPPFLCHSLFSSLPCWLSLFVVVFLFLLKLFQIAMAGGTQAQQKPH